MSPVSPESKAPAAWIDLPDQSSFQLAGDCHIGRTEGNEIVNPDTRISRRHAVIQRQGRGYVLIDLGSTNGTFLNDARIFTARKLREGDVITVGSLRYGFRQPGLVGASVGAEASQHTLVAVGKTSCWMLLVATSPPDSAAGSTWRDRARELLAAAGAGIKPARTTALFGHWREGRIPPDKIVLLLRELQRLPSVPGSRICLHHGSVRVGPGAAPGEENLVGSEVTFVHKLDAIAETTGLTLVIGGDAARALGGNAGLSPIGPEALRTAGSTPPLFTLS
ncbi:MAG TPA: FHA domain-containing protein [Candidatus Didemnitutus sp.]|jgi:hypothetical protein